MASKTNRRNDAITLSRVLLAVRDIAPTVAVAGIAFSGSFRHITRLANEHGQHGWNATAVAVSVDLLCIIGAEERQRDKRIDRKRAYGWLSWPTIVFLGGVALTLACNLATANPGYWGHIIAAIPPLTMLIAISLLERRASHAAPASSTGAGPSASRSRARRPLPGSLNSNGAGPQGRGADPADDGAAHPDAQSDDMPDELDPDQGGSPDPIYTHAEMLDIARALNDDSLATKGRPVAVATLSFAIRRRKEFARQLLDELDAAGAPGPDAQAEENAS